LSTSSAAAERRSTGRSAGGAIASLTLALVLAGCTHERALVVQPQAGLTETAEINRELEHRPATIALRDGSRVDASNIRLDADTVSWQEGAAPRHGRMADVRELSYRSRLRGALDGLLIGLAIGAPSGALVIDSARSGAGGRVEAALSGALSIGVWSSIIGAVKGSRIVYHVDAPRSDNPEETPAPRQR